MENLSFATVGEFLGYAATAISGIVGYVVNGIKSDIEKNKQQIEKIKETYTTKQDFEKSIERIETTSRDIMAEVKDTNRIAQIIKNELSYTKGRDDGLKGANK